MSVAVYAAGPVPPPPIVDRWPGVRHTFTTADGLVWDLSDHRASGVFLTDQGLRGLDMPAVSDYVDEWAGVDGQSHRGFRVGPREVFWPVLVYSPESTSAWLARDSAWWAGLSPGKVGTWTVRTPEGASRSLRVRCVPDGQAQFDVDPSSRGWQVYGVRLVADDPYWRSTPISAGVGEIEPAAFIDPAGSPPLHIVGGSPLSGLALANPGDVPAWPLWEATGPHSDLVLGIDSAVIECPDLASGEHLVIDASPWVRTALLDGVDVTYSLGAATDWRPVPAGGTRPLLASSTGSGSVTCTLVPRHYRAW